MFLSQTHIMNNQLNNQIIENASKVSRNLSSEELYEISHKNGEGQLSKHGALVVETGKHTGRSANDKFFVKEDNNEDKKSGPAAKKIMKEHDLDAAEVSASGKGEIGRAHV